MELLNQCLELRYEIEQLDEKILELKYRVCSPGRQTLNGLPKGNNGVNTMDKYMITLETLMEKRKSLETQRTSLWREASNILKDCGATVEEQSLMNFRFYHGLKWADCVDSMEALFPEQKWNSNRVFRMYRNVLKKSK